MHVVVATSKGGTAVDIMGIDISHIVDLGTHVAQSGAIRVAEIAGDDIFEYLIAVAQMVENIAPGFGA